jgi:UDP-glucose 4-epimerase
VDELADLIGTILGREPEKLYAPPRPGDVRDSWADVSAARETLGFEPAVGLEEGLRCTAGALLGD